MYEQCDDGQDNGTEASTCSVNCTIEICGNGIADPGEECDSGSKNDDNGDCRTDCIINRCGDGFVNMHGDNKEDCDTAPRSPIGSTAADPTSSSTCNANCTIARCGDHILNPLLKPDGLDGEQCDDGNIVNGDNCLRCRREYSRRSGLARWAGFPTARTVKS
jgi:cysteine-rich repeat protein